MSSFTAGRKRAAEDREDREGNIESSGDAPTHKPEVSAGAAPAATVVKVNRADAPPAANPFKGLTTTTASSPSTTQGFAGFGTNNGSAPSGGFSFGAFGSGAPTAAETAGATAASKFSFSFGAPAPAPAAAPTTTTTTPAAPFSFGAPAASAAPSAAAPQTFSFNFGAPANKPAASTTAAPANGSQATTTAANGPGFNFGAKFDFGAGVKAFAAAQTTKKEEAEEEVDPETEVPISSAPHIANALSAAAVRHETVGDESDTILLEVPHVKVFLQGVKEEPDASGKLVATNEKEWKERGMGSLKVSSYNHEGETRHRIYMHSDQTKQLVLNVAIDRWFAVVSTTEKTVAFRTVVMAGGKPKPALYNMRVPEANVKALADKLTELAPKKQ